MYMNQHSPEPEPRPEPGPSQQEQKNLMIDLAKELADRTGQPWRSAPGVGLCIDCGGWRIIFESSSLMRDRGRHNLRVEMFNRLSVLCRHDLMDVKGWEPWPQVKLTKSASAIANQLQAKVLPRAERRRQLLDELEELRRQEAIAANGAAKYLADSFEWLRIEPATGEFGQAQILGTIGSNPEMGYAASTVRRSDLVNLSLLNLPLSVVKEITKIIDQEAIAQAIDQDEEEL